MGIEKMSLSFFAKELANMSTGQHQSRFCFVLGAGASKESGIITGQELVDIWDEALRERNLDSYTEWKSKNGITDETKYSFYSEYYEERYRRHPKEGLNFLEKMMESSSPSCGYVILAYILTETINNVVVTTNFDHLTEDAVTYYAQKMPLVLGHEALSGYANKTARPTILKIHRDLLFDPANTPRAVNELNPNWKPALVSLLKSYHPVFIGYAGNDHSLMDFLTENAEYFLNGEFLTPYWLQFSKDKPCDLISNFLNVANGIFIEHPGFDETMVMVGNALGYKEKSKVEFLAEPEKRYKDLVDSLEKFRRQKNEPDAKVDADTSKALEQISDRSGRKSASQMLDGIWTQPYEKQVEMLDEAMKTCADDPWVLGMYASVENKQKHYDKAEEYYKRALEADPNHANNLGNYANFLKTIREDYDKAEEYYKRALEADPNHAGNLGNYANFLWYTRKGYDNAEEYYKRALDIDPNHVTILGNYAMFLRRIRKDEAQAEIYEHRKHALNSNS